MPGCCGAAEPQPAACPTPLYLPARAGRAVRSAASGHPLPLNPPEPQRKPGEGFFSWRKGGFALLFLFSGLVGALALNRGSLSSGAGPVPRGVMRLPKPRAAMRCGEPLPAGSAGSTTAVSSHVVPGFSLNTQRTLRVFLVSVHFAFFNKTFKLNVVRWCRQTRRGSHLAGRTLLGFSRHGWTPHPLCKWQLGRGFAGVQRSPGRGSISAHGVAASRRPCQG